MRERGYEVGNADITVIAERPKLSPVKELIRNSVAELLGCSPGVINIKVGLLEIGFRETRFMFWEGFGDHRMFFTRDKKNALPYTVRIEARTC